MASKSGFQDHQINNIKQIFLSFTLLRSDELRELTKFHKMLEINVYLIGHLRIF